MGADARRQLGKAGEVLAARHLEAAGLQVLARHWRFTDGVLDLVAHEVAPDYVNGDASVTWLVAVEVRIRRGARLAATVAVEPCARHRDGRPNRRRQIGLRRPGSVERTD